jgi:hypothetical protein
MFFPPQMKVSGNNKRLLTLLGAPIHIGGRLDQIANHISVTLTTTPIPIHIGGRPDQIANHISVPLTTTQLPINKEVVPVSLPKLGQKNLLDKRAELRATNKTNTVEKKCEDDNFLCCFWAVAGECDTNP